jgi:hypothetical protein
MFNRRKMLQILGLGGTAISVSTTPIKLSARELEVLDTWLAGFSYYQGSEVIDQIKVGDQLRLLREPGNNYDANAVEVYWQSYKLGYLPRINNAALSRLMDQGCEVKANVSLLEAHPWKPISLVVKLLV